MGWERKTADERLQRPLVYQRIKLVFNLRNIRDKVFFKKLVFDLVLLEAHCLVRIEFYLNHSFNLSMHEIMLKKYQNIHKQLVDVSFGRAECLKCAINTSVNLFPGESGNTGG